jgi:hypothetical protein
MRNQKKLGQVKDWEVLFSRRDQGLSWCLTLVSAGTNGESSGIPGAFNRGSLEVIPISILGEEHCLLELKDSVAVSSTAMKRRPKSLRLQRWVY